MPCSLDNLTTKLADAAEYIDQPLISVIVPVFNGAATLDTALQSLVAQSWQALEIIVVDDCSTDNTRHIAQQWAAKDTKVRVLANHVNQGTYAARNLGFTAANGAFITTHDADDWSHPQKLEMQVKGLLNNAQMAASISHWVRCTTKMQLETRPDGSLVHRNVSSLMMRRAVFERLGYWDRVSVNADTEYYYRILAAYGSSSIIEVLSGVPLAFGRRHAASLTMQPETHWKTQFGGVRKEYMDAAHAWHQQHAPNKLHLSFSPAQRPFPAPALINRPGQYIGTHHAPIYQGHQTIKDDAKTVLLCAHSAGKTLFGGERSLIDVARAIHHAGYRLVVTLPEQAGAAYPDTLLACASTVIIVPYLWWHSHREADESIVADFVTIIDRYNVDLVHVNTLVLREPLLAARQQKIPCLLHVRELPTFDHALCEGFGAQPDEIRENILNWADGFIANSKCTQQYINQPDRCSLLYNTVNSAEFTIPLPQNNKVRFALISSNTAKKGVDDFIELARRAEQHVANAEFVLIGPDNPYMQALRQGNALPNNLMIAGYTETPQQALQQVDVVMNLSHFQESFGRTIAEAMAAERAVIGYRWGALPELIDNGINGYLAHLDDIDGLLHRVSILANNPDLRIAMGRAGKQKVMHHFDVEHFNQALAAIYARWLN